MSILSNTIKKLEEGCGKECINCKKEFIPRNSRELTCSKECSKKHRKLTLSLYIRKFKKSNANYWADYVALNSNKYRKYNNKWRKDNSVKMTKSRRKSYLKNREKMLLRARDSRNVVKIECSICKNRDKLQVHHLEYKPNSYVVLCYACHLKAHNRRKLK